MIAVVFVLIVCSFDAAAAVAGAIVGHRQQEPPRWGVRR